ncbi:MAG TPA: DNA repair protein RadC [Thermodesulfobacteriota bacterium]|jgi:DNA repair protein RadC|nr:DNA repair protein RadC [Thermodesulfobacteriota bacterium]
MAESPYKITRWPKAERPRERLLQHGSQPLSEAELLGILLGKGTRKKTAIDLARELLDQYESLQKLFSRSPSELMKVKGIGSAKAATLSAAFELARRIQSQKSGAKVSFKRSSEVFEHYLPLMRDLRKEVFKVLLLNRANRLIKEVTISEGTLEASIVHPRDVFREALLEPAAGIILIHNHPSGNASPSEEDLRITKQLVEAGRLLGIKVYDHLILAGESYRSLADDGLI